MGQLMSMIFETDNFEEIPLEIVANLGGQIIISEDGEYAVIDIEGRKKEYKIDKKKVRNSRDLSDTVRNSRDLTTLFNELEQLDLVGENNNKRRSLGIEPKVYDLQKIMEDQKNSTETTKENVCLPLKDDVAFEHQKLEVLNIQLEDDTNSFKDLVTDNRIDIHLCNDLKVEDDESNVIFKADTGCVITKPNLITTVLADNRKTNHSVVINEELNVYKNYLRSESSLKHNFLRSYEGNDELNIDEKKETENINIPSSEEGEHAEINSSDLDCKVFRTLDSRETLTTDSDLKEEDIALPEGLLKNKQDDVSDENCIHSLTPNENKAYHNSISVTDINENIIPTINVNTSLLTLSEEINSIKQSTILSVNKIDVTSTKDIDSVRYSSKDDIIEKIIQQDESTFDFSPDRVEFLSPYYKNLTFQQRSKSLGCLNSSSTESKNNRPALINFEKSELSESLSRLKKCTSMMEIRKSKPKLILSARVANKSPRIKETNLDELMRTLEASKISEFDYLLTINNQGENISSDHEKDISSSVILEQSPCSLPFIEETDIDSVSEDGIDELYGFKDKFDFDLCNNSSIEDRYNTVNGKSINSIDDTIEKSTSIETDLCFSNNFTDAVLSSASYNDFGKNTKSFHNTLPKALFPDNFSDSFEHISGYQQTQGIW